MLGQWRPSRSSLLTPPIGQHFGAGAPWDVSYCVGGQAEAEGCNVHHDALPLQDQIQAFPVTTKTVFHMSESLLDCFCIHLKKNPFFKDRDKETRTSLTVSSVGVFQQKSEKILRCVS